MISHEEIRKIRSAIAENSKDLLLFELLIGTGIKLKNLLSIKVEDLLELNIGDTKAIQLKDEVCNITMGKTIHRPFHKLICSSKIFPNDYLFSLKRSNKPMSMPTASVLIKKWFTHANLNGDYNAVDLRKFWQNSNNAKKNTNFFIKDKKSENIFSPVDKQATQEIIYTKLLEAINSGVIPPGTKLTTDKIATTFNVSHAPARVALNRLEGKGLITTHKKKASIVTKLTIENLSEIGKMRKSLEILALKSSIRYCTEETLNLAEKILDEIENFASTREEIDVLNTEFHRTIYRDAKMPLLIQSITDLCEKVRPYLTLALADKMTVVDRTNVDIYHRKLIESMRKKDLKGALINLKLDLNMRRKHLRLLLKERTYLKG